MAWTLADPKLTHELTLQIGVFCAGLFLACMFCHGELVRLKPAPAVPDALLPDDLAGRRRRLGAGRHRRAAGAAGVLRARGRAGPVRAAAAVAGAARAAGVPRARHSSAAGHGVGCGVWSIVEFYDGTIVATRNFYGVLRVQELGATDANDRRSLIHGTILHGTQYLGARIPAASRRPTTRDTSGIGRLLESLHPAHGAAARRRDRPRRRHARRLRRQGRRLPLLRHQPRRDHDRPARLHVSRRQRRDDRDAARATRGSTLEREPPQDFDVLAIDAFSSDAIPVHLITSEAVAIYKRHLTPGGVIAFHVTNRFLDLDPGGRRAGEGATVSTPSRSPTTATRRWLAAAATGCCCPRAGSCWPGRSSPMRRADRAATRLAAVDRRFQQLVQVLK